MRHLITLSLLLGAGAVVACTGDPVVPPVVDASTSDVVVGQDSSTGDDGGLVELDGGALDDGGGDPDPDGGVLIDAGADAGPCGPPSGNGPAVTSTCSSLKVLYQGGTIAVGTYDLTGFTLTGNITYCSTYIPTSWSGKLVVTSNGNGGFHFDERATGKFTLLSTNRGYDVTASGATITASQTCGLAINDTAWGYGAGKVATDAGTKAGLSYEHALGTAVVRYRWTHQ